jgi:osmoprotectant transport system substrate-binding protein
MKVHRRLALALGTLALLATAACGGGNSIDSGSSGSSGGSGSSGKGSLTISGQNFTEMQVMAAMYNELLSNAGYDTTTKLVTTRDIYIKQMTDGKVDVVPEYLAGITDFLNTAAHGDNAKTVSSHSPNATLAALKPLAAKANISILKPSKATDQNAFFVTKSFASKYKVSTLSQLAALKQPIKLAAGPDCKGRSDCQVGLEKVYGLKLTDIIPTGFGGAATLNSVKSGESQLGETGTTDGSLSAQGLVLLKDDKGIQPAQNLTPAVNSKFLSSHPDIANTLDKLSQVLTTSDLARLNLQVDAQRQKPEDVASSYLKSKGLI